MYEEDQIKPDFGKHPQNPFRTPDSYFESLEDRIMGNINEKSKKQSSIKKIIRLMKPVLALAASFALIFMLVYSPIHDFLLKDSVQTTETETTNTDSLNDFSINLASMDENSLINAIFSDDTNIFTDSDQDDFLAYLSSGLNEVDIYSEIQN